MKNQDPVKLPPQSQPFCPATVPARGAAHGGNSSEKWGRRTCWAGPTKCSPLTWWGGGVTFRFFLAVFSSFLGLWLTENTFHLDIKTMLWCDPLGLSMGPQACVVFIDHLSGFFFVYWVFRNSFIEVQLTYSKLLTSKVYRISFDIRMYPWTHDHDHGSEYTHRPSELPCVMLLLKLCWGDIGALSEPLPGVSPLSGL